MPQMKHASRLFLLFAVLSGILAGLCFVPGLNGGFIFDDRANIVTNQPLHVTRLTLENIAYAAYSFQPGHGTRSLAMLSFALDYWRGGLDARAFKTTNILIHVATMLALAVFFRQLLKMAGWRPREAAAGALVMAMLWAIHPLQVSSVLYVVQRMQTLVTLFMVLALWAYLRMREAQLQGFRSRRYGVLTALFWVLALASKEDAVLLPLYTLALELTVLRFDAASPRLAAFWRHGYKALVVAGIAASAWLVPHFWHWDAYPGRDFSSPERLLTQGRVLVLYLRQILLPFPDSMHFFYDDFVVSRGWLQPPTTLFAWGALLALLVWAWRWRVRHPLFALGVFLFFAGHAITSNVLNLELVFEHRNHLPMIGAVLAIADLSVIAWKRLGWRPQAAIPVVASVLISLGVATASRAYTWGNPLRFAAETLRMAPRSERAWAMLGAVYVDRSGFKPGPWLDRAIEINAQGAEITGSAIMLSNVAIYKTIRGDVTPTDWRRLNACLQHVTMNVQNIMIALNLLNNVEHGMPLDQEGVMGAWETIAARTELKPNDDLRMAAYIHNKTDQPERALPFLRKAVELSPPDDPDIVKMFVDLKAIGREDWIQQLRTLQQAARHR